MALQPVKLVIPGDYGDEPLYSWGDLSAIIDTCTNTMLPITFHSWDECWDFSNWADERQLRLAVMAEHELITAKAEWEATREGRVA